VVPKTTKHERLIENAASNDFNLSTDDMARIATLDRHERYNDPGKYCEAAFGQYCPIFD
jgi:D-xylose reductase